MDIEALWKARERLDIFPEWEHISVVLTRDDLDAILAASQPARDELADARAKLAAVERLAEEWSTLPIGVDLGIYGTARHAARRIRAILGGS